jgi:secreted Zn-dependent insulinase-like peptidase
VLESLILVLLFRRNVKSLIDSNLEKFKNLWEESHLYWGEIEVRTLKFDRVDSEVSVLLSASMHVKEIVSSIKQTYYNNFSKLLSQ